MSNLGTILTQVGNLVSNNSFISTADITSLIQAEHLQLLEDFPWSRRKNDVLINLTAPVTTGTVTVSGATVTGTGTAFTAGMVGQFMRVGANTFYHAITAVASATSLTLEAALPANVTTDTAYTIFNNVYQLPADFARATSLTGDIRLTEWARSEIDRLDPYRMVTGARPDVYTIRGPNYPTVGNFQIEFWPVPSSAQTIRMEYMKSNSLSLTTDSPLYRSDILVWKSAESACYFLFGKSGDQAWLALADRFHVRYTEALQGGREDDLAKWSEPQYIRDRAFTFGRGDDFFLSHDPLWLRR